MNYLEQKLTDMIVLHEGEKLFPYRCPEGKLTIGCGRNIEDRGISEDESRYLLSNDIELSRSELEANLTFFKTLNYVRQAVLIDMHLNMGWPSLSGFQKALTAIGRGKFKDAATEMLDSRWADQVGARATRLAEMMQSGNWYE